MFGSASYPKRVIVGLGKTGLSCLRHLISFDQNIAVVDQRNEYPGRDAIQREFPTVRAYFGRMSREIIMNAEEIILSPGVPLSEPVIAESLCRGVKIIGDIELFERAAKAPIVAITGTNGKSTVAMLIGKMIEDTGMKVSVGGNLGVPALDLLSNTDTDINVLELSSFQLEKISSLRSLAAVVLNISVDHLNHHRNFADYLATKKRIYIGCQNAIINYGNSLLYSDMVLPADIIGFGSVRPKGNDFGIFDDYLMYGRKKLLHIRELRLKGMHNATNALAALALGKAIKLPLKSMLVTLKKFSGLQHRCQWITNINNVDWYNDSKGTNVGATEASIRGLGMANKIGKIVLIAGGISKGADFAVLCEVVTKYVKTIILIGKDSLLIEKALIDTCKIIHASSMEIAVSECYKEAAPFDVVLLSPACSSFDMFKNFEHRGEVFIREIKKL